MLFFNRNGTPEPSPSLIEVHVILGESMLLKLLPLIATIAIGAGAIGKYWP